MSYQNTQTNTNIYANKDSRADVAISQNGYSERQAYESEQTIFENYLTYEKKINKNKFGAVLGYSWQENTTDDGFQAKTINFISDATGYYNLQLGNSPSGYQEFDGTRTLRMISFFRRVNYNYDNRYIIQATMRNDGSSAFGVNNRWGLFPSISGAWRIIYEDFMKIQILLSDLKLKLGYGISGNSLGFDPMASLVRYGFNGNSYYNGSYISSIGAISSPNPNLKWEKTSMLNVGLNAAFLSGYITVSAEYYNKITSDLIWNYSVPSTSYIYSTIDANVGKISNKGVELYLGVKILRECDFIS